jgi:GT2 family glycosyltransferase
MKKVLVIVVTYNGMRWLERCLGSVMSGQAGHLQADLYVFDNDSQDGSADFVQTHFPDARLIRSAENLGFSKANNQGIRYALENGYDYVYLLNQDAWLAPGSLETLVAATEAHPDFAVLSPLQMTDGYKSLDTQFSKIFRYPAPQNDLFSATENGSRRTDGPESVSVGPENGGRRTDGPESVSVVAENGSRRTNAAESVSVTAENGGTSTNATELVAVKRVMAAHWLVPVGALRRIGLFGEELFPLYGQDDDWCNRARYHGLKIGVVPAARAVHDRAQRAEARERIIDRNYYTGSLVRLCDINRPLWERFCYVCLFTAVKAVKYHSLGVLRYFRLICRQLPAIREHRRNSRRFV